MTRTEGDGLDTGDVPDAFVAVIVKVYVVPFVRPVNKIGLDVPVAIMPPGFEVIVYVSAYKGGVNEIEADTEDGAATRFFGARGIGLTRTETDGADDIDVPDALVAVAIKLYNEPFIRPVTKIGLNVPIVTILPGNEVIV